LTSGKIGSFPEVGCGHVLFLLTFRINDKKIRLVGKEIDERNAEKIECFVG